MMSRRKELFHGNPERLLHSQNVNSHYAAINQTPVRRRLGGEVNTTDLI